MTPTEWVKSLQSELSVPKELASPDTVAELVQEAMTVIRQDLARARVLARVALRLARQLRDRISLGRAHRITGHTHLLAGHSKSALRSYESAWDCFSEAPTEQGSTAVTMLQALAYLGQYERAFEIGQRAIEVFLANGDEFRAARIRANLGNTLHRLDRLEEAKAEFEAAIPVLTAHQAHDDLAIVMRNFAVVLMGLQDYEAADALYSQARSFFEASDLRLLILEIDLNRAYLLGRKGFLREAMVTYRRLLKDLPEESSFEIAHCLLDQADFMAETGLWTDALLAAGQAAEVFSRLEARFELGKARLLQAWSLIKRGEWRRAEPYLKEARRRLQSDPNQNWRALLAQCSSEYLEKAGQPSRARQEMKRAVELEVSGERRPLMIRRWIDLTLDSGELEEAGALVAKHPEPILEAKWHRLSGRRSEAELAARRALAEYDTRRKSLGSTGLRKAAAVAQEQTLRECFRSLGEPRDRLEVVARLKNQALSESAAAPEGLPPESDLRRLRSQLYEKADEEALMTKLREVERLGETPLFAETQIPTPLPGERIIEFFSDSGMLWCYVLEEEAVREFALGPTEALAEQAHYFHLNRTRTTPGGLRLAEKALAAAADLLAPVLADAPARISVGRDGPLATLPIHALPIGSDRLYQRHQVATIPNASLLHAIRTRPPREGRGCLLVGSGDDLAPEIETELATLSRILGTPSVRTLDELDAQIGEAGWIHLAAHGIVREDQPLLSSMRLAGFEWTVFDVLQRSLSAGLTVLSGCSTGVSSVEVGLESQGFIEALLAAGSRTVIASLWDAADTPTAFWMTAFYEALTSAEAPEAFRLATDRTRAQWEHPGLWSTFSLFGESDLFRASNLISTTP